MKSFGFVPAALILAIAAASACSAGSTAKDMPEARPGNAVSATGENTVLTATVGEPADNSAVVSAPMDGAQSSGEIVRNVTGVLRANLARPGVKLDGQIVKDLRATSPCEGTIVTSAGSATFKWAELGNLVAEQHGATQILRMPADTADAHELTIPQGQVGDNIVSNIGLLELSCQHGK